MHRTLIAAVALALAASLAGCSRDHGFSRSAFGSKFIDRTEESAVENAGAPARIETPDANTHVLVYERKTFNQEDGNAKDALVKVTFRKDAAGKFMYAAIDFQAE
ncbi:MAG: hypothetical protein ACK54X_16715 [Burkholderiales bacterium]|jgi:hypothetical protein